MKTALAILASAGALFLTSANGWSYELTNIIFTPESPASVDFGAEVVVTFDYVNDGSDDVLIFARPFTEGELSPRYQGHGAVQASPGAGNGTGWFSIGGGPDVIVDQVRFQMEDLYFTVVHLELFVDVEFTFMDITAADSRTWGRIKAMFR
jgi:hypothetical protein